MAKRHRTRPRQRRTVDAAHRPAAPRVEREPAPAVRAPAHRVVRGSRAGYARASGAPSGALERSAVAERNFISKDLRRLALVVAIALVLLVAAGAVESAFLAR